jgi:flagellin-like protein
MRKKALSPVITTVLLVLLAIILALIIFIWARGFTQERLTKFDGTETRPAEEVCNSVNFQASLANGQISIINTGNIPIYKLGFKLSGAFGAKISYSNETNIVPGGSKIIQINDADKIDKVIPIILASSKDNKVHEFTCPNVNWKSLE